MFLWVSCKALGKVPYVTYSSFVLLPFLCSCPGDTSSSFPSRYLLCSLRALLGTVSWLWQKCCPCEGDTLGSSWDMLHLAEMALSSVRKGLWLSSVELVHRSWLLCWHLSVCVTPAPEGPEHLRLLLLQRVVKAVHNSSGGMEGWFLLTAACRTISAAGTCSSQEGEDGCQQQHWARARDGLRPLSSVLSLLLWGAGKAG